MPREPGQNGEAVDLHANGNGDVHCQRVGNERDASLDVMHSVMAHGGLQR